MTVYIRIVFILLLPTLLPGQPSIYLEQYRSPFNLSDPVDAAYLRGTALIANQSAYRTTADLLHRTLTWDWDDYTKTWHHANQVVNTYNPSLQLIGDIGQQWIHDTWVDQYRTTYVYNEQALIRLFQYEAWTGTNWELYVRFIHEYDEHSRLSTFIAQDWIENKWTNRYQRTFTYNDQLGYHRETRQYWKEDHWENNFRYTDYFDAHGRMTSNTMQSWEYETWQYSLRNLIDYGCYTEPVEIKGQQFTNHVWEDMISVRLGYDSTGLLSSETYYYLQDVGVKDNGWTFEYDHRQNLVARTLWTAGEPYWQPDARDVLSYDDQDRHTGILRQDFIDYWLNQTFTEYEYVRVTGLAQPDQHMTLDIFPNPAADQLHIFLPEAFRGNGIVSIINATGQQVVNTNFAGSDELVIPVGSLSPGMYAITWQHAGRIASGMFFKK